METYKSRVQACLAELDRSPSPNRSGPEVVPSEDTLPTCIAESSAPERPVAEEGFPSEDVATTARLQSPTQSDAPDHVKIVEAEARLMWDARGRGRRKRPKRKGLTRTDIGPSALLSARKRRRMEYARVQWLYKTCRSRCAAKIIDGQTRGVRHSLAELEVYWRPVMEALSGAPGLTPEALSALQHQEQYGSRRDYSQLWRPFISEEVKACSMDNRSAPGPDGVS
ncbi:hypothetical protein PYW07_012527 [Mythimna separata]|uniref:Uncharacterized protein n=1 Tax=Mythimna separata TaxID=271217 RepID=A0AAD7Y8M9_MYTSE|nr:hypothetical protein PYW07_012527 [Mythimna separata]